MTDVFTATRIELEPGLTLTVSAATGAVGLVRRVPSAGGNLSNNRIQNVLSGTSKIIGPFPTPRHYSIEPTQGKLSYDIAQGAYDYATQRGNIEPFTGSFTLKNEDNGKVFRCDDASNIVVTVPNYLMEGFNVGFAQWAAGTITLTADTGATKRSGGTATSAQYQRGSLVVMKNSDSVSAEYVVGGDFA